MTPHPDPTSRADRAASFTRGADVYARVRPGYPAEAVSWLLEGTTGPVLDLAAGTGLLTRRLVELGADVVAVDPAAAMLEELSAALPGVDTRTGTAERIPLADAGVGAVVVGQAWHWFDPPRAAAEIARVLRPGGTLGVLTNDRDERVDWVARFGEILHEGDSLAPDSAQSAAPPALDESFGPAERFEHSWHHHLPTAELGPLADSRSYALTLSPEDREHLVQRVEDLAATHADLSGTTEVALPYVTTAYRARRR
ncbi:class I SAM-dependent methyltransferase [Isoptericola haloaureus]|uniref:Class I SAM-dependent methyltransferase n=1 Tax=Isoptericola haloaureus TaxID=1542902 RepID=A0ABU7ZBE7_9MICO